MNQAYIDDYLIAVREIRLYLKTIAAAETGIDVTRDEDLLLVTVHEVADFFHSLGHSSIDESTEAEVWEIKTKMQGNKHWGMSH